MPNVSDSFGSVLPLLSFSDRVQPPCEGDVWMMSFGCVACHVSPPLKESSSQKTENATLSSTTADTEPQACSGCAGNHCMGMVG